MKNIFKTFLALIAIIAFVSCGENDPNDTGSEYMPDMGHSVAQEANVLNYYYYNTWDDGSVKKLRELQEHNKPVANTIPRGYAGIASANDGAAAQQMMAVMNGQDTHNSMAVPMNGSVPYYYKDTDEGRTNATANLIANPFPISEGGLARGKELYDVMCGICHGAKADGNGWLVDEKNTKAVYPAAPANFLLEDHINSSNGRYYHAIMYGKNVMGSYADKVSFEERWQIIHYIRSLQAKSLDLKYSSSMNTLNASYGIPMADVKVIAQTTAVEHSANDHGHEAHDGGHEAGHGHGDSHEHHGETHDGHENHDAHEEGHDHGSH